jgi:tetratricopeptide (TPR) repeat protein
LSISLPFFSLLEISVCAALLGAGSFARYNTRRTMTQTTKSRREVLEGFVRSNPGDAFALYGLALECAKLGDDASATDHFRQLLAAHSEYIAGYFQFGQLLARLGQVPEARQTLSAGIVMAGKTGDTHARDEMQGALDALG